MKKKIISTILSASMLLSAFSSLTPSVFAAEAKVPQYQTKARQMEELNRGLIAVKTTADAAGQTQNGVYLSWRLLGTESLTNQAFDIYRDGAKIHTTGPHDATNYVDPAGTASSTYKVVRAGTSSIQVIAEKAVAVSDINRTARASLVNNGTSEKNSYSYVDIPIQRPDDVARMGDGKTSYYYTPDKDHQGGANDASVGDLDGDGDYEIVLKWDPVDSKDSAGADFTGNVYIDAYEIDPNNDGYKWRIDLGKNVTAGAHYTQFLVYDFNGDGKAEVVMKTAPGSKDGLGNYVSEVGDTEEIRNVDNEGVFIGTSGRLKGKNPFTQYLTVFDGETGAALYTTDFIPYEAAKDKYWGDGSAKYNRSERYLAAVAYLDGVHPSIVMVRGYYHDTVVRAYTWDGSELTMQWEHIGSKDNSSSLYAVGNHNLSVADIDDDGCDEIIFGSAALDNDGVTVLGNTRLGHGDAMHVNDFNNDGQQEVFSVKEEAYKKFSSDLRNARTGQHFWAEGKVVASGDTGRGVMDNVDDAYAAANPNALALGWDSSNANILDLNGDSLKAKPATSSRGMTNFLVYWDGDLGRELLDDNQLAKYHADTGYTTRFYDDGNGYLPVTSNNFTKYNPSLVADIWGDWREEMIMPIGKGQNETPYLRILTSTLPTEYRLTTLMHDSQYRMSVAWQNVAYNQPTHTSYYIGSAALATDESGNKLNYLAPAVPYTKVTYEAPKQVAVTGMELSDKAVQLEKGKTYTVRVIITPEDATKKGAVWTSSDESVATVSNGVIKAVGQGTATITATAKDETNGKLTDTCEVTVFSTPVTGVTLSDKVIELGVGYSKTLKATVYPDSATDKSVIWTSEDESVATVENGTVTGAGCGKTKVIATTADGAKTAECIIKVKPIDIIDATGEDAFVFAGENTDINLTLDNNTKNSATLNHNNANTGAVIEKSFTPVSENKAVLSFRLMTGGVKGVGAADAWNWTGHEYTMGIKLLDSDGKNIINIYQPYKEKAKELMSVIAENEAKAVTASGSGWSNSGNVAGNIQGSSKRWKVDVEFNYDNDTCTVKVVGTGSDWVTDDGVMQQTFKLNGASFKTLQLYTTKDGEGEIKANPALSELSYSLTEMITGMSETLYDSGSDANPMTEAIITDWTQTGTDTAALAFDSESNRIWYNPTKPGDSYSASNTFETADNAIVTYDVDWYFGSATSRTSNFEYLQFGSNIRLGWTSGYVMLVSKDGGTTYDGLTDGTVDTAKSIFTGANSTYTKNVKVVYDKAENVVKSVMFDGRAIDAYSNYALAEGETIDSVTFGFQRGGATDSWGYPNGIDRIKVTQFIEGEEEPDFSELKVTGTDGNTVNVEGVLVDNDSTGFGGYRLLAALYDEMGTLKEVTLGGQMVFDTMFTKVRKLTDSVTFTNDITGCDVRVFIWDSAEGMLPLCENAEYTVEQADLPIE